MGAERIRRIMIVPPTKFKFEFSKPFALEALALRFNEREVSASSIKGHECHGYSAG